MQKKQDHSAYKINIERIKGDIIVSLHEKYTLKNTDTLFENIEELIKYLKQKEKRKTQHIIYKIAHFSYYPTFQFNLRKVNPKLQICCICQEQYQQRSPFQAELIQDSDHDIISLSRCSHMFHRGCIEKLAKMNNEKWLKCPVCSVIYGIMTGDQPEGTINIKYDKKTKCAGQTCGTIIISYYFNGGSRNGKHFPGTSRVGYLPDNQEGRKVAKLLQIAFQRKLVFTVGRSVTTGQDNVIVWNGIHHKTALSGGPAYFGYPDKTYLKRVQQQLAAKGIYQEQQ